MIEILIAAIPLLLLVAALLLGRYPGVDVAVRLGERIAARLRRAVGDSTRRPRPQATGSYAVHGGLLLAFSLSGRAPPA